MPFINGWQKYPVPTWRLGMRMAWERKWIGITQRKLAMRISDKYGIHMSAAMINSYENGIVMPWPYLGVFADYFNWSPAKVATLLGWLPDDQEDHVLISKEHYEAMQAFITAMTKPKVTEMDTLGLVELIELPEEATNEQEELRGDSPDPAGDEGE